MAVRDVPRPEAEIARRVREIVGPNVPIAGSFDLHGNEDEQFLAWADAAFVTKRYPHSRLFAGRALLTFFIGHCKVLQIDHGYSKATCNISERLQWTGNRLHGYHGTRSSLGGTRTRCLRQRVLWLPWSDVPDVGATVHVMTNDDQKLADEIADDMAEFIWRVRRSCAGKFPMPRSG